MGTVDLGMVIIYAAIMSEQPELFARIDTAKAELDALRPLDHEREARVMQKFRLWWTYHSNAIEGNRLTQGETELFLMEGLTAKGKPLKDHLDLRGHNEAVNFLLSFVKDNQEITEADIRGLHKILLVESYPVNAITQDGQPTTKMVGIGEYKILPNHVKTRTGEIHYYATPEETPAKMHELLIWYREERAKGIMHPVEIAARFHHHFTAIHPFDDGNGRMSRLLMNLMLMQEGYPPTVIRIDERDNYLVALRSADRGEFQEFIQFVGKHVVESLGLFIRTAKGEEVSEPTDLLKEMELEVIRLAHIEEPAVQTPENTHALFEGPIRQIIMEAGSTIAQLGVLFSESSVQIQSSITNDQYGNTLVDTLALNSVDSSDHVRKCFVSGFYITSENVYFNMVGFRKAKFDTFSLSAELRVQCEKLKYNLKLIAERELWSKNYFYQEFPTRDNVKEISEAVGRFFLTKIQEKTKDGG